MPGVRAARCLSPVPGADGGRVTETHYPPSPAGTRMVTGEEAKTDTQTRVTWVDKIES